MAMFHPNKSSQHAFMPKPPTFPIASPFAVSASYQAAISAGLHKAAEAEAAVTVRPDLLVML
jgi:hypothetical protein